MVFINSNAQYLLLGKKTLPCLLREREREREREVGDREGSFKLKCGFLEGKNSIHNSS
jgi:hypothetical protein